MTSVAVVIVTYNSRAEVLECLDSIRAHSSTLPEAVVVDNASVDGTAQLVRDTAAWVSVVERDTNGGLSRAINEGVANTSADHVMVLNPDTRFEGEVLAILSRLLDEQRDVAVVAPRLLDPDGTVQMSCRAFPAHRTALFNRYSLLTRLFPGNPLSRSYLMTGFSHDERRDVDWVSGAALMFPRAVFNALGGWDPGYFMFSEDVDFCRRVHDAGYRVVYEPAATLTHTIGASRRSAPARMIIERHRSMWRYYRTHLRGNLAVDIATAVGIAARCGVLLAMDRVGMLARRRRPS